jgi:hypothetical protein
MAMPVRGHRVQRSGKFDDIVGVIKSHGFKNGAPNRMACPGFYFYNRAGYVLQILPARKIKITRPDGTASTVSARRLITLDTELDQIVMDIEEQQTLKEENTK